MLVSIGSRIAYRFSIGTKIGDLVTLNMSLHIAGANFVKFTEATKTWPRQSFLAILGLWGTTRAISAVAELLVFIYDGGTCSVTADSMIAGRFQSLESATFISLSH